MKDILKPLSDFVLVRPLKDSEMTAGGIVIPETAADPLFAAQHGVIVAMSEKANLQLPELLLGATVIVPKFGGTTVKVNGGELKLFKAIEILAIVY